MPVLCKRAAALPSNAAILAAVIGASVGGGALLVLLALVFVYRRKLLKKLAQLNQKQKKPWQEQGGMSSRSRLDKEDNELEIPSGKERMERTASMRIGSPPRRGRRMDKSAISRPLNVDPLTSWSRQPPRRSVSLSSGRSYASLQTLQSAQSLRPVGLPATPRPVRPPVDRQRSLPRLPSETVSRPWNSSRQAPPLPAPVRRRERRGRAQVNRDSVRSIWED